MTEPILVVDIGTASSAAAIVAEGRTALLRDPLTGANAWPSSLLLDDTGWLVGTAAERRRRAAPRRFVEGPRRAVDAAASLRLAPRDVTGAEALGAYLEAMATEAVRVYGSEIPRLVLTVPAGYGTPDPRRDELVAIGEAAGFSDVELVDDAVAVALDPQTSAGLPDDIAVLVLHLGVTWTAACVHRRGDRSQVLAQHSIPAGHDLDAHLLGDLRAEGRAWLEPLLAAPGDAGLRAYHEAVDFVRRLKHRLADTEHVQDHLTPLSPPYRLSRQWLEAFAEPSVSALLAHSRTVVATAGAGLADISAVVLAGGAARMPIAATAFADGLGHPVRRSAEPEFAAVRGAAKWASGTAGRVIRATPPGWRTEPVAWDVPGGRAQVLRWTVQPGEPYTAGAVVAEIRTPQALIVGLTARRPGTLTGPLPAGGTEVGPVLAVPARRTAKELTGDPPPLLRTAVTTGSYLLSADRHVLLECAADGTSVRSWSAVSGELLGVFAPDTHPAGPSGAGGRIFVDPEGRPALIAWDAEAGVSVWDVQSGKLTVRIAEAVGGRQIMVDESTWRLAVEGDGKAAVGRYRRSTITVFDLHTGARVDRTTDGGWEQRHPGFRRRSAADAFAVEARSPDGQLHAAALPGGVILRDVLAGVDLHRRAAADARVAFDGDGRCLLVNHVDDGRSRLDVLQV